MGMSKRDIALAHCGVYLLAWLIRDADKKRYKPLKGALRTIHETLGAEDEATSEEDPGPKWKRLFDASAEGEGD